MSDPAGRPLVCGFGHLAAALGGIAWDLGEPGAVLLSEGEARPATFAIEEGGDAAALQISAGKLEVEATLAPLTAEIPLGDGPLVTACRAEVRQAGGKTTRSWGQISRWPGDPREGAATFRQIAIEAGEEALLIAVARGESAAQGHGEERTAGWRLQGEDEGAFEEALISTQYDGSGDPTRLGIELWAADADQTSRAAATRVSGSLLGGAHSGGAWAGFFRCHADGAEGIGTYLLRRE
jgi:hypothetical protein